MSSEYGKHNFIDWVRLYFKGIGMGAADVVPGVSGGTIAFITNIYEELIHSIKIITSALHSKLLKGDIKGFWNEINFSFLIPLLAGIGTSIAILSRLVLYLLNTYPIAIWSFFFGLIIASAIVVYRKVKSHNTGVIIAALIGALIAFFITVISPAQTTEAWWFILISGFIAICAMILPGISGSFILLLMGKYEFILNAVRELNIFIIVLFASGCVLGLAAFSNLLDWMLKKYHDITIAILAGFMIGSLNKVWPWKNTLEYFTDSHGVQKPLVEENLLPGSFQLITGTDPQLFTAVLLSIIGFAIVILIERYSTIRDEKF